MVEWIGLGIGSVGLILALISLGWQIHVHRQSKTECAEAELSWDISPQGRFLCLRVLNTGDPPLYVKKVALVIKHVEKERPFAEGAKATVIETSIPFQPRTAQTGPLQTGQERVYVCLEEFASKLYASQDPSSVESVWVCIDTPRGEVLRTQKEEVLPLLQRRAGDRED